jgi:hypothetical protein
VKESRGISPKVHFKGKTAGICAAKPLERRILVRRVSNRRGQKHARYPSHESTHKGAAQELLLHICLPSIALFWLIFEQFFDRLQDGFAEGLKIIPSFKDKYIGEGRKIRCCSS